MDKKVCIAVIGCGRIASSAHFPAFNALNEKVKVKYACDLIEDKAKKMKETYPGLVENVITDYKVALNDPEVEAVYVLTPNYAHYVITMDSLRAGKHVFCEKPITVNYELSLEMAEEAKKQNKLLNIGVCNRYNKSVEILERMNNEGKFGNIYHVYCSFRSYRCIPGLGGPFTNKKESGGGVLIDWGIHFLDLILYILGGAKLKTVTCDAYNEMAKDMKKYSYLDMWAEDTSDREHGVNDVDDYIAGHIRTDKASISFNGAWAQNIGGQEMYIDFLGDKGGARLQYGGKFTFFTTDEHGLLQTMSYDYKIPDHYQCEDEAFLKAVRSGEHTKTHIDNILESARLLDTLYKSSDLKREIEL